MRGLEMGVNDYVMRRIDGNELLARIRTQIRRKRHCDWLRARLDESVESALTDVLTGLHNRRFLEQHLDALAQQANAEARPLALLMIDIDHFKAINDARCHAAGDEVLRQFALRLRRGARARSDLSARR
jgi:two-component system cell cycle response regulator